MSNKDITNTARISNSRAWTVRGFTLVEMVVAILLCSIIAVGVVGYIADSTEGFAASSNRNRLASAGQLAIDRMALELQNALPNSVRTTVAQTGDQCIEFIPVRAASTYIDPPFRDSETTSASAFRVIDFNPTLTLSSPAGMYGVIYPIHAAQLYQEDAVLGPVAAVDEIGDADPDDGIVTVTLESSHTFSAHSPLRRLFIVDEPVSFCVVSDRLYRYTGYGFQESQCVEPASCSFPATTPGRVLISDSIANAGLAAFTIDQPSLTRNAIISIDLNFSSRGESIRLKHEVHTRNVP